MKRREMPAFARYSVLLQNHITDLRTELKSCQTTTISTTENVLLILRELLSLRSRMCVNNNIRIRFRITFLGWLLLVENTHVYIHILESKTFP